MGSPSLARRLLIAAALAAGASVSNADWILWTEFNARTIKQAVLNTFVVQTLIARTAGPPVRIAIDPLGGKMYWTTAGVGPNLLQRANLDGTGIETIITAVFPVLGVAIDAQAGHVYWNETNSIRRANLDGTNVRILGTGGLIQDMTLDLVNQKLYLTRWVGGSGRVERSNLDGTARETLVSGIGNGSLSGPVGIGVDAAGGKVYWGYFDFLSGQGKVQRANLDGTNIENVVPLTSNGVDALILDLPNHKIYWTILDFNVKFGAIQRADLDGSNIEQLPLTGIFPGGIAILRVPCPGDMNCDGRLDGADIDPFFLALGDPAAYLLQFPTCDPLNGDMNGDGRLDGGDIDPFFACLGGGQCP